MITVKGKRLAFKGRLDRLLEEHPEETSFVGKVGTGPKNALYLVSYDSVILAKDPTLVWDSASCLLVVREFVDVKITIKRRA
jgi:hypothetical protein